MIKIKASILVGVIALFMAAPAANAEVACIRVSDVGDKIMDTRVVLRDSCPRGYVRVLQLPADGAAGATGATGAAGSATSSTTMESTWAASVLSSLGETMIT